MGEPNPLSLDFPEQSFQSKDDKRLGDDDHRLLLFEPLRDGNARRLPQLLDRQRVALQLHPAAAAEPGAQGDAAGDPLHPGAAAPSAADGPRQTQRRADVHDGPVQRRRHGRLFALQGRFAEPRFPHGDTAGQPVP